MELDANSYIELLGRYYSEKPIQQLAKAWQLMPPEIDEDDGTGYWDLYDTLGISFIFKDEAVYTGDESADFGDGDLVFTNVTFEKLGRYREHILPFGVSYGDSYESVVAKMKAVGAEYKVVNPIGESFWAVTREDGQRYGVSFGISKDNGVYNSRIMLYYGQHYMEWMDNPDYSAQEHLQLD